MNNSEVKYIFSYYKQIKTPKIKHRPWWNLFGKDTIIYIDSWKQIHHIIDKSTADIIMDCSKLGFKNDLSKIIFNNETIYGVQLEMEDQSPTPYIPVSHSTLTFNNGETK